ncbi:MAG: hypothetical protein E6G96_05610 [Alphaproteobacteria bacterium]|nr:MAG: hypothetical protein E6G96_05610 [Alphaproteobacteria bacterium]
MRRFVIAAVALAAIAGGGLVLSRASTVDDVKAAKEADGAFLADLGKADGKAISGLLDRRFAWIDREGRTHNRRETLKSFPALAATRSADKDVSAQFYGRMFAVRGNHENSRFLRVFVKRHHGWKAIMLMETPLGQDEPATPWQLAAGSGTCDNPCRTVPYAPKRQMDKEILAAWQASKVQEWHESGVPADAVSSMRVFGFGAKSALMISQQIPYRGGKPYTDVRLWVQGPKGWEPALSEHVTIQSALPVPALASKQ